MHLYDIKKSARLGSCFFVGLFAGRFLSMNRGMTVLPEFRQGRTSGVKVDILTQSGELRGRPIHSHNLPGLLCLFLIFFHFLLLFVLALQSFDLLADLLNFFF